MSDRHLRRLGQDYGTAFLSLLPQGQAWPKYPGSTLDLACRGLAEYWGFVDSRAADLLERESDPRYTVELLPDWERNWGLPDPCYTEPQNYGERIAELMRRMTMIGGQSRQFYIDVAALLGYTITITEYRVWVVGMDRVGDSRVYGAAGAPNPPMRNEWGNPIMDANGDAYVKEGELSEWPQYGLGPESNRFYWTVHVQDAKLIWFRVTSGQTGIDPHLRIGTADDLECLLNRWKPAHTEIIFDYSGMQNPPVTVLSTSSVSEGAPVGAVVGTLEIQNYYTGAPTFSLVNDAGGRFKIVGNQIQIAKLLDYETATSHVIEVMAYDVMPVAGSTLITITVTNVVSEAGVIQLSASTVPENSAAGTTVGVLSMVNTTGTPVFSLASNPGGKFAISGSNLTVAGALDFETQPSITVAVAVTGVTPATANTNFTITVTDVLEPVTWSSPTNVTLSGGNLIATNNSATATNQGARVATASGKNTGKYYFEVTWTAITGGANVGVGICTTASTYSNMGNSATTGDELYASSTVWGGGGMFVPVMGGPLVAGERVGVAVDLDNRKIWFKRGAGFWNNEGYQNPATGDGGFVIPAGTMVPVVTFGGSGGLANNKFTANFGGSSFGGAVPSGFTPGWPI